MSAWDIACKDITTMVEQYWIYMQAHKVQPHLGPARGASCPTFVLLARLSGILSKLLVIQQPFFNPNSCCTMLNSYTPPAWPAASTTSTLNVLGALLSIRQP
jgi:hypothetical protein